MLAPLFAAGCFPDDWDGLPYQPDTGAVSVPSVTDDTATPVVDDGLAGSWLSEDGDLSELFAGDPFHYESVQAVFDSDGTYGVTSRDRDGAEYALTGTYTVDDGPVPHLVTLVQTEPYEATAEGIWQVDGDVLTYEVVQTIPDYGFAPPTPQSGFGTTSGPGLVAGTNTQIYRRQP